MSKRVVVVDDSKFITRHIKEFMETEMGYEVVGIGHNGNDAISLFEELKPDLITMDITMPFKDGEEALMDIISLDPTAKIVMMSAVRGETMTNCLKNGASGFIEKPLKFANPDFVDNLKEVLSDVLDD